MTATAERSGLGHQFKADQKALQAAKHSIEIAYGDLMPLQVMLREDVKFAEIMLNLAICIKSIEDLSYSADEKFNQND